MGYEVLLHPSVVQFLKKCPDKSRERIKKKLKTLEESPFHYLEHYEGADYYKLRIGDYRALVDVDFERKIIKVQILDYRKRIYK